jgi:1-acyl-sn-glycerol-3-phosphate acyltransferase
MATALFLVCMLFLLCVWDITMKLLVAVNFRLARRFVDRRVAIMAYWLVRIARAYLGLRFEMSSKSGRELPQSFVLVSNHQSVADIVALLAFFPEKDLRFVAKRSLRKWFPAVSWVLRIQRHPLIYRVGHAQETAKILKHAGKHAARYGDCPVVFPEGTRSRDGQVGTFYAGAIRTILNGASLPIVSVALDGGYRFAEIRQLATRARGAYYRIRVLSVYPAPRTKWEVRDTLAACQEEIRSQLESWRSREVHV